MLFICTLSVVCFWLYQKKTYNCKFVYVKLQNEFFVIRRIAYLPFVLVQVENNESKWKHFCLNRRELEHNWTSACEGDVSKKIKHPAIIVVEIWLDVPECLTFHMCAHKNLHAHSRPQSFRFTWATLGTRMALRGIEDYKCCINNQV